MLYRVASYSKLWAYLRNAFDLFDSEFVGPVLHHTTIATVVRTDRNDHRCDAFVILLI